MTIEDRLSVPQAARLVNVSERSIHNWIDQGKLTADEEWHGRQRRRYVSRQALLALIGGSESGQT